MDVRKSDIFNLKSRSIGLPMTFGYWNTMPAKKISIYGAPIKLVRLLRFMSQNRRFPKHGISNGKRLKFVQESF